MIETICTLFERDFGHLVSPAIVSHVALQCRDVSSFAGVFYHSLNGVADLLGVAKAIPFIFAFMFKMLDKRVVRIVVPVKTESMDGEKMCSTGDLHCVKFVASVAHVVVDDNVKLKVVAGGLGKNASSDVQVPSW